VAGAVAVAPAGTRRVERATRESEERKLAKGAKGAKSAFTRARRGPHSAVRRRIGATEAGAPKGAGTGGVALRPEKTGGFVVHGSCAPIEGGARRQDDDSCSCGTRREAARTLARVESSVT